MAAAGGEGATWAEDRRTALGQQRLFELAERGELLDTGRHAG
ncbi:hypothetical protein [Streptomyces chartreusis]